MAHGKTIELFLEDGEADGILTLDLSNWDTKTIRIPRIKIKDSDIPEISWCGVYFLLCEDGGVYVGESKNIKDRLLVHISDYNSKKRKEDFYWATAICFGNSKFNETYAKYIESYSYNVMKKNGDIVLHTKSVDKNFSLKKSELAMLDVFIENMKLILKALGYTFLEEKTNSVDESKLLFCKGRKANASGYPSDNGFTVTKGSITSEDTTPSFETNVPGWPVLRKLLESDGTIVDHKFTKNYEFKSPSAAASIVLGTPSSGNDKWENKDGIKLKDIDSTNDK